MITESGLKDADIINTIEIPEVILRLRKDGIVHATFRENTVFDIPMQMKMLEESTKITNGKKSLFIYDAEDNVTITKEARDNAIHIEHRSVTSATVVVAHNLAYRIIANFYVNVNKPQTPFKVVSSFEKGIEWLKSLSV